MRCCTYLLGSQRRSKKMELTVVVLKHYTDLLRQCSNFLLVAYAVFLASFPGSPHAFHTASDKSCAEAWERGYSVLARGSCKEAVLSQRSKLSRGLNYILSTTSKENRTFKSGGAPAL